MKKGGVGKRRWTVLKKLKTPWLFNFSITVYCTERVNDDRKAASGQLLKEMNCGKEAEKHPHKLFFMPLCTVLSLWIIMKKTPQVKYHYTGYVAWSFWKNYLPQCPHEWLRRGCSQKALQTWWFWYFSFIYFLSVSVCWEAEEKVGSRCWGAERGRGNGGEGGVIGEGGSGEVWWKEEERK